MQTNCATHRPFVLSELRRVVVFRALYLGDMLCAVPAFRALRRAASQAHIVLVSLPWAREFATRFDHYIDECAVFPGFPGLPEQAADIDRVEQFFSEMRQRKFDLAIQMHGSGSLSNRVCAEMGAKHCAGYFVAGQKCLNRATFLEYPQNEHEVWRHLRLMQHLGARHCGEELEYPVTRDDHDRLERVASLCHLSNRDYVCIHAGGKMATRRWPVERFALVANFLADHGLYPVLTGTKPEEPLVEQLSKLIRVPLLNLCGKTDLGMLAALIERASLVITNDTGVSHLAAAVRTRSVVLFLGSDRARWSPLDRRRHRIVTENVACQPCEYDVCPVGFVCATSIHPDRVTRIALELLQDRSVRNRKIETDCAPSVTEGVCQVYPN